MIAFRKFCAVILIIVAPFFCCSCPIPLYYSTDSGQARINSSGIRAGVTTKEDVFLRFGNSFKTTDDNEKLYTARYTESDKFLLLLVVAGGLSAGGVPVYDKDYYDIYEVKIEFDDNDVVKRCETFKLQWNQASDHK
jgi:hypothetical protein